MWGVLYNPAFNCTIPGCDQGRGGDTFYTQSAGGKSHVRTDAPNAQREVTPFGFYVQEGYDLVSDQMVAVRSNTAETVIDVAVEGGVPFLEKPGFEATFVACNETYREWAVVYWTDVARFGTDPIYNQDWRTCTEIQLVPECYSDGPGYEGLEETPCVADIATVL
ncbi:hypothetical protein UCRNP2_2519 [Neofusicoccum parvum UCRNP2]|uniref:Uncharacterized protein n=1 Tax=Botryosphaeria parva (strain UCR-NP2) TaxID=1287680 RepID=R1GX76_BOTPV|nr:hypothetical protein UCRNP2_2519 [Neofusicoccum parvum UCRNP2]